MLVPGEWRELWARGCRWPCWFPLHGGICRPGASGGHVGSQGMAGAFIHGLRSACWYPGHGSICEPRAPAGHVGSQGMAGALVPRLLGCHFGYRSMAKAVALGLPPAMLVFGAWWELWGRVCTSHDGSQGMVGAVGPGLPGGHVDSRGMERAVGLGLSGVHVSSRGIAGAVGPGLPLAMLVLGAWRELSARGFCRPCWISGHGGSSGPRAARRPCWFLGHGGSCGLWAAGQPC